MGGFAQALEFFVDHHGADTVVGVDLQQQSAVDGKGQDVAAFHATFAGFDAVLQVKGQVGWVCCGGQGGEQLFCGVQWQLGIDRVVFAGGFCRTHAQAGCLGHENQFIGLQSGSDGSGDFFHRQIKGLASR